ncbi:hypothetical protein NBRC116590_17090 [Pelagimonas sp. KU-00592-HH]|uniref:hypothetical protein n=1 Tax=Pelagimonas sp. KU-00592-HH TaxID=3127651 RepID=UPI00310A0737
MSELLTLFEGLEEIEAADTLFGNRQRTSTRSGILKSEAVRLFCLALVSSGIEDFSDMDESKVANAAHWVSQIPGQRSGISFDYFQMLAGNDNLIKPDRMVLRFIARALDCSPNVVSPETARELLQLATFSLKSIDPNWTPRKLDYAIWSFERAQ